MLKSQVFSEPVRDDASSDSKDGKEDELPCVIGERAGDCLTRLAQISGEFIPRIEMPRGLGCPPPHCGRGITPSPFFDFRSQNVDF